MKNNNKTKKSNLYYIDKFNKENKTWEEVNLEIPKHTSKSWILKHYRQLKSKYKEEKFRVYKISVESSVIASN
jgi:hypothetical protein